MERKLLSGIMLTLLLTSILTSASNIQLAKSEPTTWTVDDDGPADFSSIQEATNSPQVMDGDTIYVCNGTYYENVLVDKTVLIIAESKNAFISGLISVEASRVTIQGFTIHGSVGLGNIFNATIQDNALVNGGIYIQTFPFPPPFPFGNNTITQNSITNASIGIRVQDSRGNQIIGNTLRGNDVGIYLRGDNTAALDNHVEGGGVGIHLDSHKNTLANNTLRNNIYNFGFGLAGAYPNTIDTSNTINDLPIYFVVNQSNILVDPTSYPNPGYLAIINCENVIVEDFVLSGNGQGILLQGGEGNTMLNNTLVNNVVGLEILSSERNELADNTISDNGIGMWLIESNLNTIANNQFRNNTRSVLNNLLPITQLIYGRLSYLYGWSSGALNLKYASSNLIVGNTMIDSDLGVFLASSSSNTLRNNAMTGNILNFALDGMALSSFIHDIDDSNTVNGKPIIYWMNEYGKQVPDDAGYVALINSSDITIRNLHISNNMPGILVVSSNNSLISGNKIAKCSSGIVIRASYELIPIRLYPSINITVYNNIAVGCGVGISLISGEGHRVSRNDFSDNLAGIHVSGAQSNIISGNIVTNSTYWGTDEIPHEAWLWYSPVKHVGPVGISIETSDNIVVGNTIGYNEIGMTVGLMTRRGSNTIYHNNFINNTFFQLAIGSLNVWDNGHPSGGNYWSDYIGEDLYSGPDQNETGSDGIGDTPHMLAKWVDPSVPSEWWMQKDRYPLMKPLVMPDMSADLVRRGSWPEHHRFVLSRDGDPSVDDRHGTPGYQTLYGIVKNTGNVTIPAGTYEVVWNISDSTDSSRIVETVGSVDLAPGEITLLTFNVSAVDLPPCKCYVEARCYYFAVEGQKIQTFSFTVAS